MRFPNKNEKKLIFIFINNPQKFLFLKKNGIFAMCDIILLKK